MYQEVYDREYDEVVETILENTPSDEEIQIFNPSSNLIATVIKGAFRDDIDAPKIKVAAPEDKIKEPISNFKIGSKAGFLIDEGSLELRSATKTTNKTLILTENGVTAVIETGNTVTLLNSDNDDFTESAQTEFDGTWDSAQDYKLKTPSIKKIKESLGEEIGEETLAEFEKLLSSVDELKGGSQTLSEVHISLLAGAKTEILLYDISKWGEDIGVASKATFSRCKTNLESISAIKTEKVPIDVGRPRLRLKLTEEFQDLDGEALQTEIINSLV